MDRYVGLDGHARSCTLGVIGPSGKRLKSMVVETNGQALVEAVRGIAGQVHLCLEEGTQSAWLYELLAPHVGAAELAGWQSELALLNAAVKPLRAVRDRFVAHEDLATALNYHPQPLPGFSRADVEALLERIRGLFNSIEEKFLGSHASHELIIADGGEQLIASLERARAQKSGSY